MLNPDALKSFIADALKEDIGNWDITTDAVVPFDRTVTAILNTRQAMVLAGSPIVPVIFDTLAPNKVRVMAHYHDGQAVKAGADLFTLEGLARPILSGERVALNIIQRLSGIATLTRQYVDAVQGTGAVILDTRKTTPLWRELEKYAVRVGGGQNHRLRLDSAILIKDNHIALAGSVSHAVMAALQAGHREIQVECDTLAQVSEALAAGATRLLLDNMAVATLREAVEIVAGRVPLEASGGVTLSTIRAIAETGVPYISVGRITQSAPAIDIGLDLR